MRSRKLEDAEGGGAKEAKANTPRKEIKEPRRTRHFEFSARGPAGRTAGAAGPVSGQSVDKRVVRTVLNRSEYLYAGSCLRTFFAVVVVALPRVSTFRLRQRYLLDYPVLINSSGFIFIFTTPRSRQPRGGRTDRSFLRAKVGRGMTVANQGGRDCRETGMVIDSVRNVLKTRWATAVILQAIA